MLHNWAAKTRSRKISFFREKEKKEFSLTSVASALEKKRNSLQVTD